MKLKFVAVLVCTFPLWGEAAPDAQQNAWESVKFLEGTWGATAHGSTGAAASGRYTFRPELANHLLARHSTTDPGCKGPQSYDCAHGDLLYVYQDAPGASLKAIYFDNEGHVIHYDVTSPKPGTVIFLSQPSPGPQFRLEYELRAGVMSGKFQMRMTGQNEWRSYLEWSGSRE